MRTEGRYGKREGLREMERELWKREREEEG